MNIFSMLSLTAFLIYFHFILHSLPGRFRFRGVFTLMCLALAVRSFFFIFFYGAETKELCFQWCKYSFIGWAFFPPVMLHFFMKMTGRDKAIRSRLFFPAVYLPAFFFIFDFFSRTPGADIDFFRTGYGAWTMMNNGSFVLFGLFNIYYLGYSLFSIWLAWRWGKNSNLNKEKNQSRVITTTAIIVLAIGTVTDIIIPLFKPIDLPLVSHVVILIWIAGIWHARNKYRFMDLTMRSASDAIISKVNDILFLTDVHGNIVKANARFFELGCYEQAEVIDHSARGFMISNSLDAVFASAGKPLEKPVDFKAEFNSKLYGRIPVSASLSSVYDKFNDTLGLVVCLCDMRPANQLKLEFAERTRAEFALRESEERYRELFELAGDIIYIVDLDGKFLSINKKCETILEYSREEILKLSVFDLLLPEYADILKKEIGLHIKGSSYKDRYEVNVKSKSGRIMTFEISARLKYKDGVPVELHGIARDVTERNISAEKLLKSEQKYREFADSLPQTVYECDPSGRLTFVNRWAYKAFGYTREEFEKGINVFDVLAPEYVPKARKSFSEILGNARGTKPAGDEFVMQCKNGGTFPAIVHSYAVFTEGVPAGFRGIILDISEIKKVEAELRLAHEELEAKIADRTAELALANDELKKRIEERKRMEAEIVKIGKLDSLSVLAGGIAHDFNNFLTAIITNLSLARMYANKEDKLLEILKRTEDVAFRSKELTAQLLTFSRGGKPLRRIAGVDEILKNSLEFSARGSCVKCDVSIADGLWMANIDEGQMNQVFMNLAINSIQAMPGGGTIKAIASNVTIGAGHKALQPGRYVKVSISDAGIGIPPENMDKIFDPYFTTKAKGNGLGLASVYSIIKNHEGSVDVESSPGVGTTVNICIPAAEKSSSDEKPRKAEIFKMLSGRVLIMDDEIDIRDTVRLILMKWGLDVSTACDGNEAIEIFKKEKEAGRPFDLLLMDLTVPGGMGGIDAAAKIIEIDPEASILVLSGCFDGPVTADYKKYGFKNFISKPFRLEELNKTLYDFLSGAEK